MVIANGWHHAVLAEVKTGSRGTALPSFEAAVQNDQLVLSASGSPLMFFRGYGVTRSSAVPATRPIPAPPVDGVGAQLCPCGIATSTPQTFLVASLPATSPGTGVARPITIGWACTAPRPTSARLEPAYLLRGFTRWFLTYTFPSR